MPDNDPPKPTTTERIINGLPNPWDDEVTPAPRPADEGIAELKSVDDILKVYGCQVSAEIPNVAAIGGAMASVFLGILSIVGALLTPWSLVNAGMGIAFGLWGFASPRKGLAMAGILASLLGIAWNLWLLAYRAFGT